MPRQKGLVVENKPIRGLVTENQALAFPTDACTDTDNCIFHHTGVIYRRPGIDLEANQTALTESTVAGLAFNEFQWTNVDTGTEKSFVVQQVGDNLHFFDTSSSTDIGANYVDTVDTSGYVDASLASESPYLLRQMAQGRGVLFVVSKAHSVLVISWTGSAFDVDTVPIKYRDFQGLDSGFTIQTRPGYSTVPSLITNAPGHYYNVLNQGWHHRSGSSLSSFVGTNSKAPSNADFVGYFKGGTNNVFTATLVPDRDPGNSPAPKGHFILEAAQADRNAALVAEGFSAIPISGSTQISYSGSSNVYSADMSGVSVPNAFDGNNSTGANTTGATSTSWIGKHLASATTITYARVRLQTEEPGTIDLYGSNSAPSTGTDGTLLSSTVIVGSPTGATNYVLSNSLPASSFEYYWVYMTTDNPITQYYYEISLWINTVATKYPETVAFLNGRVFYSGYDDVDWASKILFTQVIERTDQYGACYQINDPTSDEIADVYPADGGVINVPEITRVLRLWPFRDQLLIIATNGIWVLSGTSGGPFSATAYTVSRVSNIGGLSPMSPVDLKGLPVWWGEDGIYALEFDPNYGSSRIKSLTEDTIRTFYLDIPTFNKRYAKGMYDRYDDTVYWLYSDQEDLDTADAYVYNRVLCMDARTGAFYPWSFTTSTTRPQEIRGVVFAEDKSRLTPAQIKFTTIYSSTSLNYSDTASGVYYDWDTYATDSTNDDDVQDYLSYLISGFRVDGQQGMKKFQGNYIYVYLKKQANAGGYLQGIYQFSAESSASGRWSTPQQIYNAGTALGRDGHSTKIARLKIRGTGQALQLRITSDNRAPFSIIGWGLYESSNADV